MKRTSIIFTATALILCMAFALPADAGNAYRVLDKYAAKALKYEKRGDQEQATEYWTEAAEAGEEYLADEDSPKLKYLMAAAQANYRIGKFQRAAELYQKVVDEHSVGGECKAPFAYVYLGLSQARLGNKDKAVAALESVPMTIGPVYQDVQQTLTELKGK